MGGVYRLESVCPCLSVALSLCLSVCLSSQHRACAHGFSWAELLRSVCLAGAASSCFEAAPPLARNLSPGATVQVRPAPPTLSNSCSFFSVSIVHLPPASRHRLHPPRTCSLFPPLQWIRSRISPSTPPAHCPLPSHCQPTDRWAGWLID